MKRGYSAPPYDADPSKRQRPDMPSYPINQAQMASPTDMLSMMHQYQQYVQHYYQQYPAALAAASYTPPVNNAYGGSTGYGMQQQQFPQSRCIYLGNLDAQTSVTEVLDVVRGGAIESVRQVKEKSCMFIHFIDIDGAQLFLQDAIYTPGGLIFHGRPARVNYGKPIQPLQPQLAAAVSQGATRALYVGGVDHTVTEHQIVEAFSRHGQIDNVKLVPDKRFAFVHFLSIQDAIEATTALKRDAVWSQYRISFAKDRCDKTVGQNKSANAPMDPSGSAGPVSHTGQTMASNLMARLHASSTMPVPVPGVPMPWPYAPPPMAAQYPPQPMPPAPQSMPPTPQMAPMTTPTIVAAATPYVAPTVNQVATAANPNRRVIYLGSLPEGATLEDICNSVRGGGGLWKLHMLEEKRCAFLTFLDASAASVVYHHANSMYGGLVIKGRRVNKVGFGKDCPLPKPVAEAYRLGASRNLYFGGLDRSVTPQQLQADFSSFGQIEQVHMLPEKQTAFVNFTDMMHAVKAMDELKHVEGPLKARYAIYRVSYGRDRVSGDPRNWAAVCAHPEMLGVRPPPPPSAYTPAPSDAAQPQTSAPQRIKDYSDLDQEVGDRPPTAYDELTAILREYPPAKSAPLSPSSKSPSPQLISGDKDGNKSPKALVSSPNKSAADSNPRSAELEEGEEFQ